MKSQEKEWYYVTLWGWHYVQIKGTFVDEWECLQIDFWWSYRFQIYKWHEDESIREDSEIMIMQEKLS